MKNKKLIILAVFFISLITISAVNAAEDLSNDDGKELILEETDSLILDSSNEETLKDSEGTFTDLETLINSSENTVILGNNYTYSESDSFEEGIVIRRELTIEGNGFTINGANLTRIFKIYDSNVIIKDINFINGHAPDYGGAIDGPATIINCTFTNNTANFGGAINQGTAVNCTFIQNNATKGGGIHEGNAKNCTFINNSAEHGGGIYGGTALDCTFKNNTAKVFGGGSSETTVINCSFTDNHADYGGAVMYGVVTNCTFINNTATDGGAIYMANASDSIFRNNSAESNGGAISSGNGNNCSFIDNHANRGGAIEKGNATNSTFINNTADYGGAIYTGASADSYFIDNNASIGGAMQLSNASNCTFVSNSAEYGGALSWTNASNCTFENNTATNEGGAMHSSDAIACVFRNNSASSSGGAMYDSNASNCTFINNTALYGGALFNANASNCNFIDNNARLGGALDAGIARNCSFINNTAAEDGGALFRSNAIACNFTNNSAAEDGGALYVGDATDCTFIYNKAVSSGGAMFEGNAIACSFINNSAKYGGALYGSNATNSNFTNNNATIGGALDAGIARNCSFINNTAAEDGGAVYMGIASNCNFTYNSAKYGGAISKSNATACYFTNNSANCGGAISKSNATACYFTNNSANCGGAAYESNLTNSTFFTNFDELKGYEDIYQSVYDDTCNFIVPVIDVSNFTSKYIFGKNLLFDLTYDNQTFDGYNITITILQNGEVIGNYSGLSGEGWIIDLEPGNYEAVLSLERSNIESVTVNLDVLMITTIISASNISTTYGSEEFLLIDFKDDEGNPISDFDLLVDLNGESKNYTTDENGQARVSTNGLVPDSYLVNISFSGNEYYIESTAIAKIVIMKASTELFANNFSTTYNMDTNFTVTLKDYKNQTISNAEIVVDLDGEKTYVTDVNGQFHVSTKNLAANTYIAEIRFNGDQIYESSNKTVNVIVSKAHTQLFATNLTAPYNTDECIFARLFDDQENPLEGFNITVILDAGYDEENFTTDENGRIDVPVKGLLPNRYIVELSFGGNENYTSSEAISFLKINKLDPLLNVDLDIIDNNVTITVDSNYSVNGLIHFEMDNLSDYITIEDGLASYMYVLDIGDYNLTVNYLGNDIFNPSKIFKEFTVVGHIKKNTTVSLDVAIAGLNIGLTVSIDPNATGLVEFNVNGDLVYAKVANGTAVLNNVFSPGEYTVNASYLGDDDFNPNTTSTSFTVKKYSSKVIASEIVTIYGTSKNLVVTLMDSNNNILIGKTVSIKLNGKTYTKITNGDGRISIVVPRGLGVKTYSASISFAGDNYFESSSKSIKVIVKKATPKLTAKKKTFKRKVKVKKYTITLKTDKNKVMKNTKLTLKVKGKTYKAKTNSKGKATFKIKNLKKKGTYKATVKFAGNKYYKKVSKKVKIKVKN